MNPWKYCAKSKAKKLRSIRNELILVKDALTRAQGALEGISNILNIKYSWQHESAWVTKIHVTLKDLQDSNEMLKKVAAIAQLSMAKHSPDVKPAEPGVVSQTFTTPKGGFYGTYCNGCPQRTCAVTEDWECPPGYGNMVAGLSLIKHHDDHIDVYGSYCNGCPQRVDCRADDNVACPPGFGKSTPLQHELHGNPCNESVPEDAPYGKRCDGCPRGSTCHRNDNQECPEGYGAFHPDEADNDPVPAELNDKQGVIFIPAPGDNSINNYDEGKGDTMPSNYVYVPPDKR